MSKKRNMRITLSISIAALILACMLSLTARAGSTAAAATGDEAAISADTAAFFTDYILDKADIKVGEHDEVLRTDSGGIVALTIVRAYDVSIEYHGETLTVQCTGATVADAISRAGITLTGAESVTPEPQTVLYPGCDIVIKSECGMTVTADGETNSCNVTEGTVAEVLSDLGITLGEYDTVNYALSDSVFDSMELVISRVEYKRETTTEVIDYGFVSEETSSMLSGTSKISQYGIEGERTVISKNKYIDGVLSDAEVISSEVTREPVDQIKLVGTKEVQQSAPVSSSNASSGGAGTFYDASGNKVSYSRVLRGTGTAYYADPGAKTATGVAVYKGGVAVNPNVIPYGTKLYIVSSDGSVVYGYATAVDTGGALMSGASLVDLFYPTYGECISFGRRAVTVYVLG